MKECTCVCRGRENAAEVIAKTGRPDAFMRYSIYCPCCDEHECPVHYLTEDKILEVRK